MLLLNFDIGNMHDVHDTWTRDWFVGTLDLVLKYGHILFVIYHVVRMTLNCMHSWMIRVNSNLAKLIINLYLFDTANRRRGAD